MGVIVSTDKLEGLGTYWKDGRNNLVWPYVFVLPPWLQAWWQVFGAGMESYVRTIRQDGSIIGIAPMRKNGDTVMFIGDIDVCDYVDFIVVPGHESEFFNALLDDVAKNGVGQLDLGHRRPDSITMMNLVPMATARGYQCVTTQEDVNVEMDLPATWENYLESLSTKQRHELRRKLRRLEEAGKVEYRQVKDAASVRATMDAFFKMFVESRQDKAAFLTGQRESFFRGLAANLSEAGLLSLGVLELDGKSVAQIICFDYNNGIYLYNSGYNPDYVSLSAGLLSKALAIKNSIENSKRKFDFLKGSEVYKYHLGGKEVPLYRCLITIK